MPRYSGVHDITAENKIRSFDRVLTKALLLFRRGYNLFDGKPIVKDFDVVTIYSMASQLSKINFRNNSFISRANKKGISGFQYQSCLFLMYHI